MTDLPRYSTRQIVLDHSGVQPFTAFADIGPRTLGHNPSWVKASDHDAYVADVSARLQQLEAEKETLHARLAVAEHHKVLSLLGKSSWQEVVEDKLRIELAETQVALAETRDALHQLQEKYEELKKARGDGR